MGTSYTAAQGKALQALYRREREQQGWADNADGVVFAEQPLSRDYGVPGRMTMCLPAYEIVGHRGHHLGYVRIGADGRVSMPREYREALEPAGR